MKTLTLLITLKHDLLLAFGELEHFAFHFSVPSVLLSNTFINSERKLKDFTSTKTVNVHPTEAHDSHYSSIEHLRGEEGR